MVPAEAESRPPRALALGFIAGEPHPATRRLPDQLFTDSTSGAEETRMATGTTKCFAGIANRSQQFCAALLVAAVMPEILGLGRIREPNLQTSRRSSI
jgi:hypothetical protein